MFPSYLEYKTMDKVYKSNDFVRISCIPLVTPRECRDNTFN
jgi:hypothetical protein